MTPAAQHKNLDWVQLLRGLAALLVVLTHARYALLDTPGFPLANLLFFPGAFGVDLFFLISGFIMCYATADSDGSPGYVARFAVKRWSRVWPAYAVATLLAALAMHGGLHYFSNAPNRLAFLRSMALVPVDAHMVPYFAMTLLVGWTLVFEMYFYAVYGASLLFKRLRWFVLAAWVLLTVVLIPLGERGFAFDVTQDLHYHFGYAGVATSPFVLEFAAGVLIGWIYLQDWARLRSRQVAWHVLGLGVALAAWAIYGGIAVGHGPLGYGWPLALMVLAMALASKTVEIRVPAVFMWLGSISYSLYLTHLITQTLVTRLMSWIGLPGETRTWGYVFLSTACALSVAALSQHYLEQRLSNRVRAALLRWLPRRRPQPVAAPETASDPKAAAG
jgi:peptidoglycan/LPS O-acetylase OafA/YrhL